MMRFVAVLFAVLMLGGCTPLMVQQAGKPPIGFPVSPPYIVIMFEMMVLFGGIATLIGMVVLGRLPKFRVSPSYDPRFTNDRFGVAVHCPPERTASVRDILGSAGAEEVRA